MMMYCTYTAPFHSMSFQEVGKEVQRIWNEDCEAGVLPSRKLGQDKEMTTSYLHVYS